MNLKRYLPTRRELIRDVSIGAVVAGAAGFGAAKLFPSEASTATEAEISKVTDNGAITLGPLGSRNLGASHRLLSGETVTFEAPPSSEIANATAFILGSTPEGLYGFQATQKGFALYGHGPDFPLDLNGTVSSQGGTLAHYTIRNRTSGSRHLALWQGAHHDLYSYIPDSLADAISLFSRFNLTDTASGLTAIPKSGSGHSIVCTKYSGGDWQCGNWQKTVCPAVV